MPENLKNILFTRKSLGIFSDTIKKYYPTFNKNKFITLIFDQEFDNKELMAKMHHTTKHLYEVLPKSYKDSLEILKSCSPEIDFSDIIFFSPEFKVFSNLLSSSTITLPEILLAPTNVTYESL